MRKQVNRVVKYIAHGHRAMRNLKQDLNPAARLKTFIPGQ